jgi:GH18 family chitinase
VKQDTGTTKVLTVALPISTNKLSGGGVIDWHDLANTFDWINLMAFDSHGEFDAADPSLQTAMDQAPASEIMAAVNYLTGKGVNPKQIVVGAPTYTREMLVKTKPSSATNYGYGYGKDMNPIGTNLTIYKPDTNYADAPNAEDYYPSGGMVDNTGVYSYNCMLQAQRKLSVNYCPAPTSVPTQTDNRGLFGQPLPSDIQFTTISDSSEVVEHAWAYGSSYSVIMSPSSAGGIVNQKYTMYPVFSYDTPATVGQKANKLVKANGLGGMWFWDIHNDAYKSADANNSLYLTVTKILGTNTKSK